jgi:hypothetical protein
VRGVIGQASNLLSLGQESRLQVWREHGAGSEEAAELLRYAHSPLHAGAAPPAAVYPLADEPFVAAWERYVGDAEEVGVLNALRRAFVQLRFPIAAGISASAEYRMATRRGILPGTGAGVALMAPERLRLFLHPTAAGRVPVIVAGVPEDFVALVQGLTRRNEPEAVPRSMGACLVAGYNNWDRFSRALAAWSAVHPERADPFGDVAARKAEYQDRFILVTPGPYSATPAAALGLRADEWDALSLRIRLEHECAHYVMRRAFGVMRESLLDEIVADYAALVGVTQRFRAEWFLRFMGLEAFPSYRAGGRLENYRGSPPLSDAAFAVLQRAVRAAALALDTIDARRHGAWSFEEQVRRITGITRLGIEGLAIG